jgi:hypothetical protein
MKYSKFTRYMPWITGVLLGAALLTPYFLGC